MSTYSSGRLLFGVMMLVERGKVTTGSAGTTGCVTVGLTKASTVWSHYDILGRTDMTVTDLDGNGTAPVWDTAGALTSVDPLDRVSEQTFSAAGKPVATIAPPHGFDTNGVASYAWVTGDQVAKRVSVTGYLSTRNSGVGHFPGGARTILGPGATVSGTIEYDGDGQVARQSSPLGGYVRFERDVPTNASELAVSRTFAPSPTGTGC